MDFTPLDDQTLMQLMARGYTDALSVIYDRYCRLVFSVAFAAVNDQAIAEDVTQEAFTRLWENADSYRAEQGKLTTWLTSITRNRAIDLIRKQKSRPEGNQIDWEDALEIEPDGAIAVEEEIELAQSQQRLRRALAQLPMEQRQVLAMAYFFGYSQQKISTETGLPLGTVKTRIRLGMDKLRVVLSEENGLR